MVGEVPQLGMSGRFRTAGKWFAFATVLLDAIGVGIIFPIMPDLLVELGQFSIAEAAFYGGFLATAYAVMQFFCSPIIGNLSDSYGRRPVLLISLAAMAVDYLILGFASTIWVLFLGRILAGIAGATYSTATAYLADVSSREDRAKNFGLVGAAFGVGFVVGPVLGGVFGEVDVRAPFFLAAGLSALNFVFGAFVLPESLPVEKRRPFTMSRANPLGVLLRATTRPILRSGLTGNFIYGVAGFVYPAVWSYFGKERFGWSASTIGLSLAAYGLCVALVKGWLIRHIISLLGEKKTIIFGVWITALAMIGTGLAPTSWFVFLLLPISALGDVVDPALIGVLSGRVPDDEQGELQGVLASSAALESIIAPVIMTGTFTLFADRFSPPYLPGAPFLLAALLVLVAGFPLSRFLRN